MNFSDISNKYETYTFINISLFDLFEFNKIEKYEMVYLKKYITTKYFSLALKYHPDKYNPSENYNKSINKDDISSGVFLSYINDINKFLLKLLNENFDMLINIINGKDNIEYYDDYHNLKFNYDNNNYKYDKASSNEINNFDNILSSLTIKEEKISESKINELIEEITIKRNDLKNEKIFSTEEMNDNKFNNIFNKKFEDFTIEDSTNEEIMPFNYDTSLIITLHSTSTLEEAYAPIKRYNICKNNKQYSYSEIINEREEQDKIFKNPKIKK